MKIYFFTIYFEVHAYPKKSFLFPTKNSTQPHTKTSEILRKRQIRNFTRSGLDMLAYLENEIFLYVSHLLRLHKEQIFKTSNETLYLRI
jgi:hypothetical protein